MTTLPQTTAIRLPRPNNGAALAPAGPVGPHAPGAAPAFAMTGADVWRVIRTNLWLIIGMLVLSTAIGVGLYFYLLKKHASFTATGFIEIKPAAVLDLTKDTPVEFNQQMLAIEQRTQVQFLTHESLLSRLFSNPNKKIRETGWFKQFANGSNPIAAAKQELSEELSVRPIPDSKLVAVSMSYRDGKEAKIIVEDVVNQHLEDRRQISTDEQLKRGGVLKLEQRNYERQLDEVMGRIRTTITQLNIDGAGTPATGRLVPKEEELRKLIDAQYEIQRNASLAKSQLDNITEQQQNGIDPPGVEEMVNRDQDVMYFKQAINDLDVRLARMAHLGEQHREVQKLRSERDSTQTKLDEARGAIRTSATDALIQMAKSDQERTEAQLKEITERIASANADLGALTYKMTTYLTDRDEEEVLRTKLQEYKESLERINQAELQRDLGGVKWGQQPETPDEPSFPRIPMIVGGCIAVGLALSLGIAFLREVLDTSVRSPRDIARVGQLNLLGMIPHEDDDPQSAGVPLHAVIFQAPHSMMAEQFRQVRTRLQQSAALDATKSILVTSPGPQDGKSMVASNLAAGLALNGRRILLVDGNFRRPEIHKVFNIANDAGFSTVLGSLDSFAATVQQTQVPNLDVLPSGPKPANATELLESQLLIDFIERALEEYDHVIFDSGPMLVVSETVALAPRVDGVITVVRARLNSRGLLQRMRDEIRKLKAEHLGVVLNAVRAQAGGYYNRNMKTYYAYQNGHGQ
ncbi:MAG: polysaccharide biosynthesis tyrosine autokinase [Tepidisphaeraceae bacterium]